VWEHFQHLFINEAVRQWRHGPRLLACIRFKHMEDIFNTMTLSMFDICTNVYTLSVWLPIVNTSVLGDITKPAITIAGV